MDSMKMMNLIRRMNCYIPSQFHLEFEDEFIDQRFLYTPFLMNFYVWIVFLMTILVISIYPKKTYENYKKVNFLFRKN